MQIVALYEVLMRLADNPIVALNHAVAVAMVKGPQAGLDLIDGVAADSRLAGDHRVHSVRANLYEMLDQRAAARAQYETAAKLTSNLAQRRFLDARAARLIDNRPAREAIEYLLPPPCPSG